MKKKRHFDIVVVLVPPYLEFENGIHSISASVGFATTWHKDKTWSVDLHLWVINVWFGWVDCDENARR